MDDLGESSMGQPDGIQPTTRAARSRRRVGQRGQHVQPGQRGDPKPPKPRPDDQLKPWPSRALDDLQAGLFPYTAVAHGMARHMFRRSIFRVAGPKGTEPTINASPPAEALDVAVYLDTTSEWQILRTLAAVRRLQEDMGYAEERDVHVRYGSIFRRARALAGVSPFS